MSWRSSTRLCAERSTADTPQKMRAAIYKTMYSSTSALAQRCHDQAMIEGLSGEDAMTLLAFHALCALEEANENLLHLIDTSLKPMFVVKPGKVAT